MDILEKLNKAFGGWYESLFGSEFSDLRPKDVLRQIITAMEDCRKEGLDNRVYVPNKYVLEIAFENDEEKEYLLAFLDRSELETAIRKYMTQNKYHIRGPLDFVIEETPHSDVDEKVERLRIKCKWDIRPATAEPESAASCGYVIAGLAEDAAPMLTDEPTVADEDFTVAGTNIYDASTVAPPTLAAKHPDGGPKQVALTKQVTVVGRSSRLNNDIVLERDGMVSKRHAKIALGSDGFTVTDLNSTNGVWVNDERVDSRLLRDGDVIRFGATEFVFGDSGAKASTTVATSKPKRCPHLVADFGRGKEEFPLASEITLGRALSCDVRFDDSSVSRRHAKITREGDLFYIEDLASDSGTEVNDMRLAGHAPMRLRDGDVIQVGEVELRFEMD